MFNGMCRFKMELHMRGANFTHVLRKVTLQTVVAAAELTKIAILLGSTTDT